MRYSKISSKREVYSNTGLPQETKISNKQPDLPSKGIRKRSTNKAQSQQKEGNDKFREEIKKIETKKTVENINKTKSCIFLKIKLISLY